MDNSRKMQDVAKMRYMPHLDALRGCAILLVLVEHFGGAALNRIIPIGAGTSGVHLFFVLSGFLITGQLLDAFHTGKSGSRSTILKHFYLRRALRLLPIFYVTLVVLAVLDIADVRESWPWHAAYLSNMYAFWGGKLTIFWTLAVEEQFYLIWPLLVMITPIRLMRALCLSAIAAGWLFKAGWLIFDMHNPYSYTLLISNLELLGMGGLLAVLSFRDHANDFTWFRQRWAKISWALAGIVGMTTAVSIWAIYGGGTARFITLNLTTSLFYGWLVILAANGFTGWIGMIASFWPLRYIGRISYGIYVIHNFLPYIVERPEVIAFTGELSRVEMGIIVIPLSFILPMLSWHLMERPIQRLKNRIGSDQSLGARQPELGR
jgi:peptidoglycan/LPS O-acetylase OafA/YrhL